MKLETWISKAVVALQQEGFTSSTISNNYCMHWRHILDYARPDSILNKAFIEDVLTQSGERNLLSIDRECMNYREMYVAHAMRSLLHFRLMELFYRFHVPNHPNMLFLLITAPGH